MRSKRRWRVALAALGSVALALPLGATLILPQELGQLAATSTDIVRGRVTSLVSRWDHERTLIVTDVRLALTEIFKGDARGEAVLTLDGGRIEDLVLDVVGSPSFALDEEVVVFARRRPDGSLVVPDLYQGKYRVESDRGALWVSNDAYSLGELLPQRASALDVRGRLSWEQFKSELERAVRRSPGGAR